MSDEQWSKTIKTAISDRLASPLTSAYLISWLLINYKIPLIIFTASTLKTKLDELDKYFVQIFYLHLPNGLTSVLNLSMSAILYIYIVPLIYSLLYVYLYPHINIRVIKYVNKQKINEQNEQDLHTQRVELNRLTDEIITLKNQISLTHENHATQITQLSRDYESQTAQLNNTILELTNNNQNQLNELNNNYQSQINELHNVNQNLTNNLSVFKPQQGEPVQTEILKLMLLKYNREDIDIFTSTKDIYSYLKTLGVSKAKTYVGLVQLKQQGAIMNEDGDNYALLEQGLVMCQNFGLLDLKDQLINS